MGFSVLGALCPKLLFVWEKITLKAVKWGPELLDGCFLGSNAGIYPAWILVIILETLILWNSFKSKMENGWNDT